MNKYHYTKMPVANRGVAPDSFLDELIAWAWIANSGLFERNANVDIYSHTVPILGPWQGLKYRVASLLEVMRVLGGFESSWNWNEGVDLSAKDRRRPETQEAGLWQVSMDSVYYGEDLGQLSKAKVGTRSMSGAVKWQEAMKKDHVFAMEYIVRLLRHTTQHNGPVKRHEIDQWLSRDAVAEFVTFLS